MSKFHTGFSNNICALIIKDLEFIAQEENITYGVTIHLIEAACNKGQKCHPYHPEKYCSRHLTDNTGSILEGNVFSGHPSVERSPSEWRMTLIRYSVSSVINLL